MSVAVCIERRNLVGLMSGHGGLEDGREEPDEVGVRMEDIVGLVEGDGDREEPDEVGVRMEDIVVIVERESGSDADQT